MLHSNYLDQSGYMTTAELEQVLSYIARLRDGGEIMVLSNAGILMADEAVPVNAGNFLINASAGEVSGSWSQTVSSRSTAVSLGVPHEAHVWVKGAGAASLEVNVSSATHPVAQKHSVALGSSAQRLSVVVTPPLNATQQVVTLNGNFTHTGIVYRPI